LELNDLASYGFSWSRTDEAAGESSGKNGGAENGNTAYTHEESS
jgi:hypothetical protein